MASPRIDGRKVAVLATNGFEQSELEQPVAALTAAGATVHVIAPKGPEIQGWEHHDKGRKTAVDLELAKAKAGEYDALVLPGGVINPDALRLEKKAIAFIGEFVKAGKPIGAICHGPWTLIDAGGVEGKTMTSWPSLETDLKNAGAKWVDKEVVVDQGLITSRKPDDIPAFCKKLIEEIAEGRHAAAA
ncbi:type 1 glutamine amidotransferase domain-containing protein [Phenylobacterium sp.]|uniref:type 1 glutamine amidotransferase domain-containing protein n=1 Tax=Phenylobacterium sp. TaxID=1871053 RepID=UPI002730C6F6|nr:type 1 glutamine amidotransferase domain-containing protein [Phenylobacterium sp.]MDP1616092.1 type 1 glutamine amidotransferase domain-containing protein [Phenylobacterium sp.]MDP1986343.1 type 1 glutamine amidotransferase domain-containing protein [Phenylobacterium sp.]